MVLFILEEKREKRKMQELKRTGLKILFFIAAFCTVPYFSYLKLNGYMIVERRRKKRKMRRH